MKGMHGHARWWMATGAVFVSVLLLRTALVPAQRQFSIEEAAITDIHSAIRSGQTSCRLIVQAYISRAKAYNGTCTALVTKDGAPVPPATGAVRAGAPLTFPTQTVPVSSIFPNFGEYGGLPFEFGRMESTISDPRVQQQFGMRVGIPNAGQLNALETLNIRGERSVTCKGDFDRAPSAGPLPPGAPAVCEEFRKQPDALERAAELDAQYGTRPDLKKLPMYCAVFSIKNWYDAKDMRATGGNDVNFAMDAPKVDSPDVATLRKKGAIIYAVATANSIGGVPWSPAGERDKPRLLGSPAQRTCRPCCLMGMRRTASGADSPAIPTTRNACRVAQAVAPACRSPRTS